MSTSFAAAPSLHVPSPWEDSDTGAFRESVQRFIATEMVPHDPQWRREHSVGHAIWRKVGTQGFLGLDVSTELGGQGGDFRFQSIFASELNRHGLTGLGLGVHTFCAHYLAHYGTAEQQRRFLPRLISGEQVGALAMTEPSAGSDLQGMRTRAVRDGDAWVVNGSKTFITNGTLAGLLVLAVKTDPEKRSKGMSLLLVETRDLPGFRVGRVLEKIGQTAQDTAELFFDDVRIPVENLLGGAEGQGFAQLMNELPYERLHIAVEGVGAMEGALAATIDYTRERRLFGKGLGEFQNTRFRLAELATQVRVARAFLDQCIQLTVAGRLDGVSAAMAKLWCTEAQQAVVDGCVQVFGGYGYMQEYLVARLYADARPQRIYGGTNEVMKELIARAI